MMGFQSDIRVELTAADPAAVLERLADLGISIRDVKLNDAFTGEFTVDNTLWPNLTQFSTRHGITLKILGRSGIFWKLRALWKRPVLILGMILLILFWIWFPSRVFLLEVEGNQRIPDRRILEAAETCGIRFGAKSRDIRSEKMKNALLSQLPELRWAGINTYGARAVISVREGTREGEIEDHKGVSSIVACRDGLIQEITATKGTPTVSPGDVVTQGQVLISGYTDCGLALVATRAEGEIFAQTSREITVKTPSEWLVREKNSGKKTNWSLLIGKNIINFYFGSGIYDSSCVKMCYKYVLTLPGGYELPLALISETVTQWDTTSMPIPEGESAQLLKQFTKDYLTRQMIAGQILKSRENITQDSCYTLTGHYTCREMIGRVKAEEIGENHGKTD